MKDTNGKEIKPGMKIKCRINGCLGTYHVKSLRPRKNEVVVIPGHYYKSPKSVEIIDDQKEA